MRGPASSTASQRAASPLALLLGLAAALGSGCASAGEYVWVDAYLPGGPPGPGDFVITAGDVVGVHVSGQEALATQATVRADGKISLPLVNDQFAAGLTTANLALLLSAQYKTFIKNPVVTVQLEVRHPDKVSVVGAVAAPGTFLLTPGAGVLQALALAGGLTPFAHRDRIFVLRREDDRKVPRIRFSYSALLAAEPRATAFELQNGDVVVVE